MKKVELTGSVPICPHCQVPTTRTSGMSVSHAVYYPPIYDKNGVNTNPDKNDSTTEYKCLECNEDYTVGGNHIDGYFYL